jgi:hypothetical protein
MYQELTTTGNKSDVLQIVLIDGRFNHKLQKLCSGSDLFQALFQDLTGKETQL